MANQFKDADFDGVFDSVFEQFNKTEKRHSSWRILLNWLLYRNMVKRTLTEFANRPFDGNQLNWSEPYQDKKFARWGYFISTSREKVLGVRVEGDHLKVGYVSTRSLDKNKLTPDLFEMLEAWEKVYGNFAGHNTSPNFQVFNIVEKCSFKEQELSIALEKVWKAM